MIKLIHVSYVLQKIIEECLRECDPDYPVETELPVHVQKAVQQLLQYVATSLPPDIKRMDAVTRRRVKRLRREDWLIRELLKNRELMMEPPVALDMRGTVYIQLV